MVWPCRVKQGGGCCQGHRERLKNLGSKGKVEEVIAAIVVLKCIGPAGHSISHPSRVVPKILLFV